MPFKHLSCDALLAAINANQETYRHSEQLPEPGVDNPRGDLAILNQGFTLIDIRDPQSFANGHIEGAIHIDNGNVDDFLMRADKTKALVVCCYHGNSSQSAADFFQQQGFVHSYSLDGGFEHFRTLVQA